ncbi:MFS transporter [Altererythrobacter fulvus]|uniref:spinster family MFS transporter n=1 Tax=Caenibius fulvus TaxID=2126012 RepID=UPI00301A458D
MGGNMGEAAVEDGSAGVKGKGDWTFQASYGLGFLTLISAFNYLDRSLLGLALPAIKAEMHVSDTALGLVSGFAFLLFYSLMGVPIAWLADHRNRRNIIAIGFAFWSLMTFLTGWVGNIVQLGIARFLMGAGEACGLAPSNSMISDLFRKERRALAFSIFGTASSIAFIVFFPLLGQIGEQYGWRQMFMVAGVPGVILALVFFLTVREPPRGASLKAAGKAEDGRSIWATLRYLFGSRAYVYLLIASTLMGLNVFAASVWTPTLLERVHGLTMGSIASIVGPLKGIFGFAGVLAGGLVIDRLLARSPRWRVNLPALACVILAPVEVAFLLSDVQWIWMAAFAASAFLTLVHQGPLFALVTEVASSRMRAVAIATIVLFSGLLGQAIGPLIVGMLNDHLAASVGDTAIRYSMLVIALTAALAGLAIFMAGRHLAHGEEGSLQS